jgi:hypothetical protein
MFAAAACLAGAVFAMATSMESTGSSSSRQAKVEQTASTQRPVQMCSATEKCVPASPLNSPAPVPQIVTLGFIAASVAVLADLRRRGRLMSNTPAPFSDPLAIFRPPIAS